MTLTPIGKNEEGENEFIGTRQEWDKEDMPDYLTKQAEEDPEIFEEPKKIPVQKIYKENCFWCGGDCFVRNHCKKCGDPLHPNDLSEGEESLCGKCI